MWRNLNYFRDSDVAITLLSLRKFCYVNTRDIDVNKIVIVSV